MFGKASVAMLVSLGITTGTAVAHGNPGASPGSTGELDPLLLSPRQVTALTGANMIAATLQTNLGHESDFTDQPQCASAWAPIQASAYAGTPSSTFSAAALADSKIPRGVQHNVIEAVFGFASTRDAADYVGQTLSAWRRCSNQMVTYTPPGKPGNLWRFGPVSVTQDGTMLAIAQQPQPISDRSCERALTHRANIVIDTMACGKDSAGQAVSVAGAIGDRITRTI